MTVSQIVFRYLGLFVVALTGLVALLRFRSLKREPSGNDRMIHLAGLIHSGAMTYLKTQYRILLIFVAFITLALFFGIDPGTAIAFVFGAGFSMIAGYIGMNAATIGNVRTTDAARTSLSKALSVAFKSGSVMGLAVAMLGLLGVSIFYLLYSNIIPAKEFLESILGAISLENIAGFGMGASSIALFARVGGGIFTKSADVGADLVGKLEAGIPEDDPRNPAVIADNVGDNVGDVAGMGADLFESYVGSIIAAIVLALGFGLAGIPAGLIPAGSGATIKTLIALPIVLAALGTLASIAGVLSVKLLSRKGSPATVLRNSTFISTGLSIVLALGAILLFEVSIGIFWALICGVVSGTAIGLITEYYTQPVRPV